MNRFCKNCPHSEVPAVLKELYRDMAPLNFFKECPINNDKIYGCTMKYLLIDWKSVCKYSFQKGLLTRDEKKVLADKGWLIPNR